MFHDIVFVYKYWDDEQTIPGVFVQLNSVSRKYEICVLEPNDSTRTLDTKVIGTYDTGNDARIALQEFNKKENEVQGAMSEGIGLLLSGRKFN